MGQESDGDTVGTKMAMPFTLGMWKDSEPTVLTLEQGDNKLTFWRVDRPQYGFTVKSFTVKPVKLRVPRPW